MELMKEKEELRQTLAKMEKIVEENKELQSTMVDYENTTKELTSQLEHLRGAQRERTLLEEEFETVTSTLGRVQIDKSQMERDIVSLNMELERLTQDLASLNNENLKLQEEFEESRWHRESKLEEELRATKAQIEKEFQEKFDRLEKDNEKLTKEMLKHMRRADELSETLKGVNNELKDEAEKCEMLSKRISDLETQNGDFGHVQSKLKLNYQRTL